MSKAMFLAPLEAREAARADAARAAAPVPPGGLSKLLGARRRGGARQGGAARAPRGAQNLQLQLRGEEAEAAGAPEEAGSAARRQQDAAGLQAELQAGEQAVILHHSHRRQQHHQRGGVLQLQLRGEEEEAAGAPEAEARARPCAAQGSPGKRRRLSLDRLPLQQPSTPPVPPSAQAYRSLSPSFGSSSGGDTGSMGSSPGAPDSGCESRALWPYGVPRLPPHARAHRSLPQSPVGCEARSSALSDALTAALSGMSGMSDFPFPDKHSCAVVGAPADGAGHAGALVTQGQASALQAQARAQALQAWLAAMRQPQHQASAGAGQAHTGSPPNPFAGGWAAHGGSVSPSSAMVTDAPPMHFGPLMASTSGATSSIDSCREHVQEARDAAGALFLLARDSRGGSPVAQVPPGGGRPALVRANSAPASTIAKAAEKATRARKDVSPAARAAGSRGAVRSGGGGSKGGGRRRGSTSTRPVACPWCGDRNPPMWRRHPTQDLLLCNACGVKCRRRAASLARDAKAAAAAAAASSGAETSSAR